MNNNNNKLENGTTMIYFFRKIFIFIFIFLFALNNVNAFTGNINTTINVTDGIQFVDAKDMDFGPVYQGDVKTIIDSPFCNTVFTNPEAGAIRMSGMAGGENIELTFTPGTLTHTDTITTMPSTLKAFWCATTGNFTDEITIPKNVVANATSANNNWILFTGSVSPAIGQLVGTYTALLTISIVY